MQSLLTVLLLITLSSAHKCGDPRYSCPDSSTCCKLEDGEWGCCPIQDAVCCEDHIHCCPDGSSCDVEEGRCIQKHGGFTSLVKKHRAEKTNEMNEVVCPDRRSKCPDETTCCLLSQGQYGCCPSPSAVCCSDHLHCCPNGMNCDPTGQRCVNREGWEATPWLRKFPSTPIRNKPAVEVEETIKEKERLRPLSEFRPLACGPSSTCPAHSTCCVVESEGEEGEEGEEREETYMCCPLQNAVCCGSTCCPHDFHCVEGERCEKKARHFHFDY